MTDYISTDTTVKDEDLPSVSAIRCSVLDVQHRIVRLQKGK